MKNKRIPLVIDTDIGGDIDDAWALAFLLCCPEVEIKMVISATGDTVYRAKVLAKTLDIAGAAHIPVAIGVPTEVKDDMQTVKNWVSDYELKDYPGEIYHDGINRLIDLVQQSEEKITILSLAALSNIAKALELFPSLAPCCNFVGMQGSLYKGYDGAPERSAEYNVKVDIKSCQKVFQAPWNSMTISPLDTCGLISLSGEDYSKIYRSEKPLLRALIEQYRLWHKAVKADWKIEERTSTLYDTVAAFLTFSNKFMRFEKTGIRIDNAGFTIPDSSAGNKVNAAVAWSDLPAFQKFLCQRLIK